MGCAFALDRDAYGIGGSARVRFHGHSSPSPLLVCVSNRPFQSIPRQSKYKRCDISGLNPIESKHGRFSREFHGGPFGVIARFRALTRVNLLEAGRTRTPLISPLLFCVSNLSSPFSFLPFFLSARFTYFDKVNFIAKDFERFSKERKFLYLSRI